ncbi:MAG: hypothetical protein FWD52_01695 [Candidatus Bathyarchaeota archaeon]|nr:hypothetical protein [Candidatus Termiticorpusculum sp.]
MRKCTVLMLITCLAASSLIVHTVTSVSAQAGYKPSAPQVIIKLMGYAYEESSSTEAVTDPFTGKDYTITHASPRVADWSFEFTAQKQPFTPYTDVDGKTHGLRYVVEYKNHHEGEQGWKAFTAFAQYESQYTTITHTVICKYNPYSLDDINSLPDGSKLDFRVKAEVVYSKTAYMPDRLMPIPVTEYVPVASSGWSSVQTFTLTYGSSSTTPSQTVTFPSVTSDGGNSLPQSPDQTQPADSIFTNPFFTLSVGVLLGGIVVTTVLLVLKRHLKTPTYTNNPTQTNPSKVRHKHA